MDNKPLESDEESENLDSVEVSEETEENLDDLFDNSGVEDVGGEANADNALTLEEINQITKRDFKSKEDFEKHYRNLASLVGKKTEPKETVKDSPRTPRVDSKVWEKITQIEEQLLERNFIDEVPEAKSYVDLVKSVAKANSLTYQEAWEKKLKEIVTNAESHKKESEIGVKSKNRINPMQSQKINKIVTDYQTNPTALKEQELVKEMLGL